MKSFIIYFKTLAWPFIPFLGRKFRIPQYPAVVMETPLPGSFLLLLWSPSCGPRRDKPCVYSIKMSTLLLSEAIRGKINIPGQKTVYPQRTWQPPEPAPLLHAGSFLPQLSGSHVLYWKLWPSHWHRSAPLCTRGKRLHTTQESLVNRELEAWGTDISKWRHLPAYSLQCKTYTTWFTLFMSALGCLEGIHRETGAWPRHAGDTDVTKLVNECAKDLGFPNWNERPMSQKPRAHGGDSLTMAQGDGVRGRVHNL